MSRKDCYGQGSSSAPLLRGQPPSPSWAPDGVGVSMLPVVSTRGSSSQWTRTRLAVTLSRPTGKVRKQSATWRVKYTGPLPALTGEIARGQKDCHSLAYFVPKAELLKMFLQSQEERFRGCKGALP